LNRQRNKGKLFFDLIIYVYGLTLSLHQAKNYLTLSKITLFKKHSVKKLILFATALTLLLYSCSKSDKQDIAPGSSISATIDGVNETFNSADSIRAIGTTGIYVSGSNATNNDRILFYLVLPDKLAPGTYKTDGPDNPGAPTEIMFLPGNNEADGYYTYYVSSAPGYPGGFTYTGTITISSITSTGIQGTFAGSLVWFNSVGQSTTAPLKVKTVTNGKFNILHKF